MYLVFARAYMCKYGARMYGKISILQMAKGYILTLLLRFCTTTHKMYERKNTTHKSNRQKFLTMDAVDATL